MSGLIRGALAAAVAAVLTAAGSVALSPAAHASDPCTSGNAIACENSKPGSPASEWEIDGAGDPGLQGFATQFSVDVGETESFKVKTTASSYTIDIYRLGWYGGDGARKVASVTPTPRSQPNCIEDQATELYDCGNWSVSASWTVPADAVSGVYVAHLENPVNLDESQITFVVRDDSSHSDVVFQTSDATWQAYNTYGGSNLYSGPNGRAYKVSYNRPFTTRGDNSGRDFLFANEYPMLQFLERNGYDTSYIGSRDTAVRGSLLTNHKVFVSTGHDEYWSGRQRDNVEAARDAGVNLAFFSGNEVYWKTRWEPSIDGSDTADRTLVCYKETWADAKIDPSPSWTGTWRDPRWSPPSDGGRPENGLTGTAYMSNDTDLAVTVSAAEGKLRLWRNTSLTSMSAGQTTALADHTVGYESDEDLHNGARPSGLIDLSTTTGPAPQYLQDYGRTVAPGTTTHHVTLYRAPSGALVFGAGTIQWAWGLSQDHDGNGAPADPRIQQATINVLADMGAPATTVMSGLVASAASTDTEGPTTVITSPTTAEDVANGATITVTGTATDAQGRVAGVEVSTDDGATWHPASGTTAWTYSYTTSGVGSVPVKARAVDDSANIGAVASVQINVSCPCSLFGDAVPATPSATDSSAVELGVRFVPSKDGFVTAIRFYKGVGNTGTHTGSLWTSSGTLLATGTFTGETASGWQTLQLAQSVPVTAGTTYVASYFAPAGGYAADAGYFSDSDHKAPPLAADGRPGGESNGVYRAGGSGFPTSSYGDTNYYVDVLFTVDDTSPPTVTSRRPLPDASSVPTDTSPRATFARSIDESTLDFTLTAASGNPVQGTATYDAASNTATFAPSSALARATQYTASVTASSTAGVPMDAPVTWTFTTAASDPQPGSCPCSIWTDSATPDVVTVADPQSVELGVKFTADVDGQVTGIKFYKGPQNLGAHVGSLWSSDGSLLASAQFVDESSTGWQTVYFSTPVDVTAGTTYVASYRAPSGAYSATSNGLTSAVDSPPLHTVAGGGVYTYGTGFPLSPSSANYWVDVVFTATDAAPTVESTSPGSDATSVPLGAQPSAVLQGSVRAGTAQMTVADATGTQVAGYAAYDIASRTVSFAPSALLDAGTRYTATISGATALSGAQMAPYSWSFTTSGPGACPCGLFDSTAVPGTTDSGDGSGVSLGVKFTASEAGYVTGVRFYKSTANTGTHTGSLWSADGTLLARATFSGESASGWQEASFDHPVQLAAGTTYVASYFAPSGHYAATGGFFANPWDNVVLAAPAGANGVYRYGSDAFPTSSYNSSNYWVTPVFEPGQAPDTTAPGVMSVSPVDGATSVGVQVAPSATFSEDVDASTVAVTLKDASGGSVSGSVGYDAGSRTATFTPDADLARGVTYTARVVASDAAGNVMSPKSWSFTTAQPAPAAGVCPCSVWDDAATPDLASVADTGSVELGVKFTADVDGLVTGARFYKGPDNTGTHTGSLWSADGTLLAKATFSGESAAGWQTVTFDAPVPVTAGTTYVVSYRAPKGGYAVTGNGLSQAVDSPPLHTVAGGAVYTYGTGFPDRSSSANYWVDVVFDRAPDTTAPGVMSVSPVDGATSVGVQVAPSATFSEDVDASTVAVTLKDASGGSVSGSVGYDAGSRTATFTPDADLARGVTYTARVVASDAAGNVMSPKSWSFTTAQPAPAAGVCPCSVWDDAATPDLASVADTGSVELGVKFTADVDGLVTGARFYKGPDNTGTHTGSLWSADGTLLAKATFSGESAAGWQTVTFDAPVPVTAGTTYVVSYRAPKGGYAVTGNGLSQAVDSPPLHTVAGGAVYTYGTGFPDRSSSANYWVDVVFDRAADTTAPTVTKVAASGSGTTATVTWATDEPSTSVVDYGTSPGTLDQRRTGAEGTAHAVDLDGLAPNTRYYFRVTSADAAGNATTSPAPGDAPAEYVPDVAPVTQTSAADFSAGTGGYVADTSGGELLAAPVLGSEFRGTSLPQAWTSTALEAGGGTSVAGGVASVSGSRLTTGTWAAPRSVAAAATLRPGDSLGWGSTAPGSATVRASFVVGPSGAVTADVDDGTTATSTPVTGDVAGSSHVYRIDWTADSVVLSVDGSEVTTQPFAPAVELAVVVTDPTVTTATLDLDWVRVAPYAESTTYTSTVLDAGARVGWDSLTRDVAAPTGTGVVIRVRTGSTATPDASWSAWATVDPADGTVAAEARYLQYEVTATTSGTRLSTPATRKVVIGFHVL